MVVILVAALCWGLKAWPRRDRWWYRVSGFAALGIIAILLTGSDTPYHAPPRYPAWQAFGQSSPAAFVESLRENAARTTRGQMIAGAFRAWRTAPWLGIGPGMHENLWPHFAASPDGDRETGTWPLIPTPTFTPTKYTRTGYSFWRNTGSLAHLLFLAACRC